MKAYVLIQTQAGSAPVGLALKGIPGIEATDDLTGAFDAIAMVTVESMRDLLGTVIQKIRELPGVTRVLPAPLVRPLSRLVRIEEDAA